MKGLLFFQIARRQLQRSEEHLLKDNWKLNSCHKLSVCFQLNSVVLLSFWLSNAAGLGAALQKKLQSCLGTKKWLMGIDLEIYQ